MFKKAESQITFGDATFWCSDLVKGDTFYGKMARYGHKWFRDEDYEKLYSASGRGRASVPPSVMIGALVLQNYDKISDRELADRMTYDLRYKAALRLPLDFPGVDPSLFSVFRARLLNHELEALALERSLERARQSGVISRTEQQAVDSMPILGAAAVQDTYTLMRTSIEKILWAIGRQRKDWKGSRGFQYPFQKERYLGKKRGKPDIDWHDHQAKLAYLKELLSDARLLVRAIDASGMKDSDQVAVHCQLLRQIIAQDLQLTPAAILIAGHCQLFAVAGLIQGLALPLGLGFSEGQRLLSVWIKKATSDRILSTNDPEMRHGHKSKSKLFDGYKGHFTVSVETELVTGVEITAANVADNAPLVSMVDKLLLRGLYPGRLFGDGAYGSGECRAELAARGIEMYSRLPVRASSNLFPKSDFIINTVNMSVTCPAGHTVVEFRQTKDGKGRPVPYFEFPVGLCRGCSMHDSCVSGQTRGRRLTLNYHEEQLQNARIQNEAPEFRQEYKKRLVVERVQSRLKDYSLRVARYFGVKKVRLQALFAATANNFWRVTTILEKQAAMAS